MFERTIWYRADSEEVIEVIDQRFLPHENKTFAIHNVEDAVYAIKEMVVRGAPLIGVTAAYAMYLSALDYHEIFDRENYFSITYKKLLNTRPTAINLKWALDEQIKVVSKSTNKPELVHNLKNRADTIALEDMDMCQHIGLHGIKLIEDIFVQKPFKPVQIMTHCNAGRLATVEWGTATSAIYQAHKRGIPIHVWVNETRPRSQGASLTAWELAEAGVPHTLIVDSAAGHIMQRNQVDMIITGADRVASNGDVCNKIGTYMKALAARENNIPFYVAFPASTIDWDIINGKTQIPIEERDSEEILWVRGVDRSNKLTEIRISHNQCNVTNYAFDITPAKLISGFITERGICEANEQGLRTLYPEK